jgi:hypothetical protein
MKKFLKSDEVILSKISDLNVLDGVLPSCLQGNGQQDHVLTVSSNGVSNILVNTESSSLDISVL